MLDRYPDRPLTAPTTTSSPVIYMPIEPRLVGMIEDIHRAVTDPRISQLEAEVARLRADKQDTREAFLDMIADARDWHDEPDGDETGDHTTLHLITHHSQMERLIVALGIKPTYCQTVADAIDAALNPQDSEATPDAS